MGNQVHTVRRPVTRQGGRQYIRLFHAAGNALQFSRGGLATLAAAETVRRHGRKGDEVLIHINPKEFRQLIELWGEPSVNPYTGLPEYGFLSKAFKKVKKGVKKFGRAIKKVVKSPIFRAVLPIALNLIAPGLGVAVGTALGASGAAAGIIGGAVVQGAIGAATGGTKGAIAGALTGGLGGSGGALSKTIGSTLGTSGSASNVLSSALLGGTGSKIQGGSFTKGALTGGALAAASPYLKNAFTGGNDPTLGSEGLFQSAAVPPGVMPSQAGIVGGEPSDGVGPPVPSPAEASSLAGPPSGELDFSQGPPAQLGGPLAGFENPGGFDASQLPAPQAPQTPGFLDNALQYAKDNPLKVGLGALTLANSLGRSAPQAGQPQVPQVPLPQSFFRPLPIVPFDRRQTVAPVGSYYNYGSMPERMWFQGNQTPPPPNDDEDEDRGGFAMGGLSVLQGDGGMSGESWAVEGDGAGREDLIDAKLSDGEYVLDAETVSMLGDGSSKAGAKKLDEMRAMIRKHKAKHLSKGQMSPDAMHPTQYLQMATGGKVGGTRRLLPRAKTQAAKTASC